MQSNIFEFEILRSIYVPEFIMASVNSGAHITLYADDLPFLRVSKSDAADALGICVSPILYPQTSIFVVRGIGTYTYVDSLIASLCGYSH